MDIEWEAPEFEYRDKRVSWYRTSIAVTIIILAFAVWQRNFLFSFFIILAEILVIVWANRQPNTVRFALRPRGFEIVGRKFYPYADIEAFSIRENEQTEGEWGDLIVRFHRRLRPFLKVHVPKKRIAEITEAFGGIVQQVELEDSIIDNLQDFVRF